jgi:hypothetical protein
MVGDLFPLSKIWRCILGMRGIKGVRLLTKKGKANGEPGKARFYAFTWAALLGYTKNIMWHAASVEELYNLDYC